MAQLVEPSLPIPEVCSSNPVIGNIWYLTFNVNCIEKIKIKKRRPGWPIEKKFLLNCEKVKLWTGVSRKSEQLVGYVKKLCSSVDSYYLFNDNFTLPFLLWLIIIWSSLVLGDEGSYLPNRQINLDMVHEELSISLTFNKHISLPLVPKWAFTYSHLRATCLNCSRVHCKCMWGITC